MLRKGTRLQKEEAPIEKQPNENNGNPRPGDASSKAHLNGKEANCNNEIGQQSESQLPQIMQKYSDIQGKGPGQCVKEKSVRSIQDLNEGYSLQYVEDKVVNPTFTQQAKTPDNLSQYA